MHAHVAIDSSAHESPEVLGPTMPGIWWDPRPEPSSSFPTFSFFSPVKTVVEPSGHESLEIGTDGRIRRIRFRWGDQSKAPPIQGYGGFVSFPYTWPT